MRVFANPERRFAIDAASATCIFQKEFNLALDALEKEREHAANSRYEFRNFDTFRDVHEVVCRYLADTNCSEMEIDQADSAERVRHVDQQVAEFA